MNAPAVTPRSAGMKPGLPALMALMALMVSLATLFANKHPLILTYSRDFPSESMQYAQLAKSRLVEATNFCFRRQ